MVVMIISISISNFLEGPSQTMLFFIIIGCLFCSGAESLGTLHARGQQRAQQYAKSRLDQF